jgi:hypothetical protein
MGDGAFAAVHEHVHKQEEPETDEHCDLFMLCQYVLTQFSKLLCVGVAACLEAPTDEGMPSTRHQRHYSGRQ